MGQSVSSKISYSILSHLNDLEITSLQSRGGLWEIQSHYTKDPHLTSNWVISFCHLWTVSSLPSLPTPPYFPSCLGMGIILAWAWVRAGGVNTEPGPGNLGSRPWTCYVFFCLPRNYWSRWKREWCGHTGTLVLPEGCGENDGFYRSQSGGRMIDQ